MILAENLLQFKLRNTFRKDLLQCARLEFSVAAMGARLRQLKGEHQGVAPAETRCDGRWREKPEIGKNPPESGEITLAQMKNHLYADVARETC